MHLERIVLGSRNQGKISEWTQILEEAVPNIKMLNLTDFEDISDPEESGKTFEENAEIKASSYAKQTHEYVLSEDGGYEVDALNGAPGVKSRRILPGGNDGSDQELIDYVLEKLKDLPAEKRGVSLTCAAALSDKEGNIIYEDKEKFRGVVSLVASSILIPGYPFRSIHLIPELGKTYAELTQGEHKRFSHKRKIAKRLAEFLQK